MNVRIVDEAKHDGCSLILTCDNGIAAFEAAAHAKAAGLSLIITDHHEVHYDHFLLQGIFPTQGSNRGLLHSGGPVL